MEKIKKINILKKAKIKIIYNIIREDGRLCHYKGIVAGIRINKITLITQDTYRKLSQSNNTINLGIFQNKNELIKHYKLMYKNGDIK